MKNIEFDGKSLSSAKVVYDATLTRVWNLWGYVIIIGKTKRVRFTKETKENREIPDEDGAL
jgi:spore cortex formation protein SpoVR/YcgB (stage V sporulation)